MKNSLEITVGNVGNQFGIEYINSAEGNTALMKGFVPAKMAHGVIHAKEPSNNSYYLNGDLHSKRLFLFTFHVCFLHSFSLRTNYMGRQYKIACEKL